MPTAPDAPIPILIFAGWLFGMVAGWMFGFSRAREIYRDGKKPRWFEKDSL